MNPWIDKQHGRPHNGLGLKRIRKCYFFDWQIQVLSLYYSYTLICLFWSAFNLNNLLFEVRIVEFIADTKVFWWAVLTGRIRSDIQIKAVWRKGADSNLPPFFVMVSLRFYHGRPKQVKKQVNLFYLEVSYNLCGYSNGSITSTVWIEFTTKTVWCRSIPHKLITFFFLFENLKHDFGVRILSNTFRWSEIPISSFSHEKLEKFNRVACLMIQTMAK